MRKMKSRIVCILTILCMTLTGCKESDVIQNLVYTDNASEVDDMEAVVPDENGDVTENGPLMAEVEEAENSDPANEEQEASEEEKAEAELSKAEQDDAAMQNTGIENANQNTGNGSNTSGTDTAKGNSTDGENSSDISGTGSGTGNGTDGSKGEGNGSSDETNPNDPGNSGTGTGGGRLEDDPNARQVYDKDGKLVTLPEYVSRVAAAGSAAVAVQMLGGTDEEGVSILCASSESFTKNQLAQQVFEDEGISGIATLWEDDGSKPMSEENFNKLLEMHPDCCIAVSGETNFSDEQIIRLAEADIPYVLLPSFDMAYQIEESVQIIGEVLGDRQVGNTTSEKLAAEYVKYEQALVKEVKGKYGFYTGTLISELGAFATYSGFSLNEPYEGKPHKDGYNTVTTGKMSIYIDGWDQDAYYQMSIDGVNIVNQQGMAMTSVGWYNRPVYYYMAVAGVGSKDVGSNYTWYPHTSKEELIYPMQSVLSMPSEYRHAESNATINARFVTEQAILTTSENMENGGSISLGMSDRCVIGTGSDTFPAWIVADHSIKEKLEASKRSSTGLYRKAEGVWKFSEDDKALYYPLIMDIIGSSGRNLFESITGIQDDYEIYVNPYGVGSWADGSVESCLEAVWISELFYDGYTDNEVKGKIKNFYSDFYRCELSDTQVNKILDGK